MKNILPQNYQDIISYFESIELKEEEFNLNDAEKVMNAKAFVESHIRVLKNSHKDVGKPFYKRLLKYKEILEIRD